MDTGCSIQPQTSLENFVEGLSTEANALSIPPGKYSRKAKTQRNWRGPAQAVERVVQFDGNRRTLPGLDI